MLWCAESSCFGLCRKAWVCVPSPNKARQGGRCKLSEEMENKWQLICNTTKIFVSQVFLHCWNQVLCGCEKKKKKRNWERRDDFERRKQKEVENGRGEQTELHFALGRTFKSPRPLQNLVFLPTSWFALRMLPFSDVVHLLWGQLEQNWPHHIFQGHILQLQASFLPPQSPDPVVCSPWATHTLPASPFQDKTLKLNIQAFFNLRLFFYFYFLKRRWVVEWKSRLHERSCALSSIDRGCIEWPKLP